MVVVMVAVSFVAAQQGEDLPAEVGGGRRGVMGRFERLGEVEGEMDRDERVEAEHDDAKPCRPPRPTAPEPTHRRQPHAGSDATIGASAAMDNRWFRRSLTLSQSLSLPQVTAALGHQHASTRPRGKGGIAPNPDIGGHGLTRSKSTQNCRSRLALIAMC
jgi:hypothetical protein